MIKDIISGAIALLLSLVIWVISSQYVVDLSGQYGLSPATFPRLLSGVIAVLGLVLILKNLPAFLKEKKAESGEKDPKKEKKAINFREQILFLVITALYVWSLSWERFLIPTMIFFWAMMVLFKVKPRRAAGIALVFSLCSYFIFVMGLKIPLGRFL